MIIQAGKLLINQPLMACTNIDDKFCTKFIAMAWRGKDNADVPEPKYTYSIGKGDFWAPSRGYAVYIPQ